MSGWFTVLFGFFKKFSNFELECHVPILESGLFARFCAGHVDVLVGELLLHAQCVFRSKQNRLHCGVPGVRPDLGSGSGRAETARGRGRLVVNLHCGEGQHSAS